ncbi:DUF2313 domain-containing protein [Paenibacillus sp. 7124]|uniref:DUF2313 domain-containing protein n=1 Tax=Paenibacillus apii TaxID=1850370 RepID=A0A6M1PDC3_9BACL|nr:putative phage tail protein [Paenibacillus apii]NGM81279.1 DUF2313 domain-containing protein [Paenibacillus apii]
MYKDTLTKNLHKLVRTDSLTNEINGSIGLTMDNFDERMDDFSAQLDIDTATWALPVYENELGIVTDVIKSLTERREQIVSMWRVTGKTGAAEIKLVANSYTHGDVDVYLDNGVTVEFTNMYGVPSNIDDLKKVVRAMTPAHLRVNYVFKYYTYAEMKTTGLTYEQIAQTGLTYEQITNRGLIT